MKISRQPRNDSKRLFGAVAIGKKVRFYRFDGKKPYEQQIVQLDQSTFDMGTPDGIVQVEDMMNYIMENAWQWANQPLISFGDGV